GEFQQTTSYRVTRVQDVNTCEFLPIDATATVEAVQLDASFTIIGPADGCSPHTVEFEFNQISGVHYEWDWFDGTARTIIDAQTDDPNRRITHTFANATPTTIFDYGVTLEATDTLQSSIGTGNPFICTDQSVQTITVYPTIIANVFTQDTPVCSGDPITFTNQSRGANNHRWFYREEGNTGQELDVQIIRNPTFIIDNPGPNNPQRYEVIYQGFTNQGGSNICEAFDTVIVEVYKDIIPNFTFTPADPVFLAGSAQVEFDNTSSSDNDPLNFEYNWNFDDGIIITDTPEPGVINYDQPGLKTVTLDIVNKAAPGVCDVSITQTFTINDLPINPDFDVTPINGCIPTTITITNLTTGSANEFTWTVFDENNVTVFESVQLAEPGTMALPEVVLDLFNDGLYSISLTARNTFTDQRETIIKDEIVTIFPTPLASFDVRPDVVFLPDQPLATFNFSEGEPGQEYFWDFGDGGTSFEFDPIHIYEIEGEYEIKLVAFNEFVDGVVCSDTLLRPISVREGGSTRIPNAFTNSLKATNLISYSP
ncbi:MAG: PKD domain-containing protein, partial [Bacteroidota bacterium]